MNRLSVAVLLLFASTAGYAQETGTPSAQPDAATAPAATNDPIVVQGSGEKEEEKVVCRRETSLGSIRARRVCRTQSQIAQEEAHGQRTLDTARTQRQSQTMSQNRSGG